MGISPVQETINAGRTFINKLSSLAQYTGGLGDRTSTLDSIFREIDELRNQLRAPVVRLPSDLLSDIFLYCREFRTYTISPTDPEDYTAIYKTFKPFDPLILSWVCRRWRSVALETPLLWTKVIFRPNQLLEDPFQAQTGARKCPPNKTQYSDRYQAFVQRSQRACLSLDLELSAYYGHWEPVQEVERLIGYERSISRLKLAPHKSEYEAARKVLQLIQEDAVVLDLSDRRGGSREPIEELDTNLLFGARWPRLRHLSLCGLSLAPHTPPLAGCLPRLRHLTFDMRSNSNITLISPKDLALTLAICCGSLVELFFSGLFGGNSPVTRLESNSAQEEFAMLPNLLHLSICDVDVAGAFLPSIRTPALKILDVREPLGEVMSSLPNDLIPSFVTNSDCRLTSLSLLGVEGSRWEGILSDSARFGALRSITFGDPHDYQPRLRLFAPLFPGYLGKGVLDLPHLEEVILHAAPQLSELEDLLSFVLARRELHLRDSKITPIRRLAISTGVIAKYRSREHREQTAEVYRQLVDIVEEVVVDGKRWNNLVKEWRPFGGHAGWVHTWSNDILILV